MEHAHLAVLAADRWVRIVVARTAAVPLAWLRLGRSTVPELVIAPQDLRTADPTIGADILAGRFAFAGKLVTASDRSIFELAPPSAVWASVLHGFGWLRDLKAVNTAVARANARSMIEDWLAQAGRRDPAAWVPDVVARRLLAWLSHSPFLLEDSDVGFYRRFVRSIDRQAVHLHRFARTSRDGLPRLEIALTLAMAALCLERGSLRERRASLALDRELRRQILPDGGHVSRNPRAIIDLLTDLLPLRQAYLARSVAPPESVMGAIDRMMPMLRFYRHGDGTFVLFNGMGPTPSDLVATLLAYDHSHSLPVHSAPHAGYQRLSANTCVVLLDTGRPPPPAVSQDAHAGTLAFEFSDGAQRLVVSCGVPDVARAAWQQVARATAAHSTLVVADTSSSRIVDKGRLGTVLVSGPRKVATDRREAPEGIGVTASHDGYAQRFRLRHQRSIALSIDGSHLVGEDTIVPSRAKRTPVDAPVAVRFHLHPMVKASRVRDGKAVLLVLPNRTAWEFTADDVEITLEESVFLGGADGPRRTEQIVLHGRTRATPVFRWRFEKRAREPGSPRGDAGSAGLPL
jgi:uncharacterized heparinase superfamily protein